MANDNVALATRDGGDLGSVQIEIQEAGIEAAQAREQAQVRTAAQMAMMRPRDDAVAWKAIVKAAQRASFAQRAEYRFPRGGSQVSGPSVHLAREAARLWGNIRTGVEIVASDEMTKQMHVRGFAWDMQTNAYVSAEAKFKRLVQRKRKNEAGELVTLWVEPDERDLRELVNKHGAICVRNAILQLLPSDVIEDAVATARQTMIAAEAGSLKEDRGTTTKKLIMAFDAFAVSVKMIETYLGHALADMTAEELADLRAVYNSMKDGNSKREDHFGAAAPVPADRNLDDVKDRLKGNGKPAEPAPATAGPISAEESARLDRLAAAQAEAEDRF